MQKILIIGAGRSSTTLIKYLIENSQEFNWSITVADISLKLAQQKAGDNANGKAIQFDITNQEQRTREIDHADIVISMLPAHLHLQVATDCVLFKKNMVTASYVSDEIQELHEDAKKSGIVLMNEVGLDPGLDHMSSMKIIDDIKDKGGEITSFKSYCGGLIAPESNDNPWGYKFTWNPRNVILAGQGTAQFIENGNYRYIPYNRLYDQIETVEIPDLGKFDAYANRDSLSYREPYGLDNIPTMLRGTLRNVGYCKAWNAIVQLGFTDDSYTITDSSSMTYREFVQSYLPDKSLNASIKEALSVFLNESPDSIVIQNLEWLDLFADKKINLNNATPAQILQDLLEEKWKLKETDLDMIIMQHQFKYVINENQHKITSSLIVKGDDATNTAMAITVGMPLAIVTKLILLRKTNLKGVHIPISKEIYEPVLNELAENNIIFQES